MPVFDHRVDHVLELSVELVVAVRHDVKLLANLPVRLRVRGCDYTYDMTTMM